MPTYREDMHTGHKVPLVETDDISNSAVTLPKLAKDVIDFILGKIDEAMKTCRVKCKEKTDDLQNQIDSLEVSGLALSNVFGDDTHIGVSQKALTTAFNKVWDKLEDITGESLKGIDLLVSPSYYIGEDGCTLSIVANTVEAAGIFEKIQVFVDDSLVAEAEEVSTLTATTEISDTVVVKCVARILGIEYTKQKEITHYGSFWMGAGSTYSDIMDVEHVIPITKHMRGAYNLTVANGEHIIIVVGESLREGFIRADINGVEIPFNESTVTVDDKVYKVFISDNTYAAGTYNIDING